ncbi:hypothetical protein QEG98_05540 [Myxococcus sp. MxC21-1]|uniref:hypothetical protein n=1 Tax=Myxococcus sp. MxC21-1 TaxID=3041439 RepID=UPI0029318094|nr:hypothetical protein [Myxococcus sp. MxC21-1]WNZ63233.1 hypothetical protein QEG98_05540 [Myxococcus sp. MxC21-1]
MALAAATHAEAAVGTETGAQRRAQRERLLARQEAVRVLKTAHEGLVADEAEAREAGTEVKAAKAEVEAATVEARAAETRRTQGKPRSRRRSARCRWRRRRRAMRPTVPC